MLPNCIFFVALVLIRGKNPSRNLWRIRRKIKMPKGTAGVQRLTISIILYYERKFKQGGDNGREMN